MVSPIPDSYLFTEADLHLCDLPQIYMVSNVWFENGMQDQVATYDLAVRSLPRNRNFFIANGIEEIVHAISNWHYSEEEVVFLEDIGIVTPGFAYYLRNFRFSGDVLVLPEGTIFFPGEPVVRITAPMIEGNLLTLMLMNTLISNTMHSTKIIRSVIAAKGKLVGGPSLMRGHGFESNMKAARAGYICGATQTNPAFQKKYRVREECWAIGYHAFIKSFPSEVEAMRAISRLYPTKVDLMIDTYNFDKGLEAFIIVALEQKEAGQALPGVCIDSGDLSERARLVRKHLDEAGLQEVTITVAGNMDEYKIEDMVRSGVPADCFTLGTEISASADDPKLEVIYKMAEVRTGDDIRPLAKLAVGKQSLPGRKQVYRRYDEKGTMHDDIIGVEDENLGEPLLIKAIDKGTVVMDFRSLDETRNFVQDQIKRVPDELLRLETAQAYPVHVSEKITGILEEIRAQHA